MRPPRRLAAVLISAVLVALLSIAGAVASPAEAAKKRAKSCAKGISTPGYAGYCKNPKLLPAPPLPPVALGSNGRNPETYVDAAGTAHIVWNQDGGIAGPDVLRYCRLKRGSKTCDNPPASQSLVPDQPGEFNSPAFNEDLGGPRILAQGDQLVFITHRYPNVTQKPDGTASSRTTYEWTSDNGGTTVSGPVIIGDAEPSGGAVVYGENSGTPKIGLISATRTDGTLFQGTSPGKYTSAQALLGSGNALYSGSLISTGDRPLAAFADLSGNTLLRHWTGAGDPNDPTKWSQNVTKGTDPLLAAGPSGAFMVTTPPNRSTLDVRALNDIVPGKATSLKTGPVSARDMIVDDAGKIHVGWVDSQSASRELVQRVSSSATRFGSEQVLARAKAGLDQVDLGAARDGGGFAAYAAGANSQGYGTILASPFGNQAATGVPGIGNLPGGGADPNTKTSCTQISYGGVEIQNNGGACFAAVKGRPGVKASTGTVKINGLEIVPDDGVEISIGTRAKTIDADGAVTVQVANGTKPIKLWHGPFHVKFPAGEETVKLPVFPGTGIDLKGFPVSGSFEPRLKNDGVEIPIEIRLPKSLGGFTAGVTVRADNKRDLHLDSMRFALPKVEVGPLKLADLAVNYSGSEETWSGKASLNLLKVGLDLKVVFKNGKFDDGSVVVTPVPYPGLNIAPDTFIKNIFGELKLGDDNAFAEGGLNFGIQPLAPPATPNGTYVFVVRGALRVTFRPNFLLSLNGQGFLGGEIPVASSSVSADLDGHFNFDGQARFKFPAVEGSGVVRGFIDTGKGNFGASIKASASVGVAPIKVTVGAEGAVSNEQFFVCQSLVGGFRYVFKTRSITPYVFSCPGEPEVPAFLLDTLKKDPKQLAEFYRQRGIPQPVANAQQASASQAAGPGFTVPRGVSGASVNVIGFNGAPNVTLVSPSGRTIAPVPANAAPKGAAAAFTRTSYATVIGLRRPQAGRWRVVEAQPGSVGVVTMARALPKPKVRIKVSGRGRKRTLRYMATARPGLAIKLVERIGKGGHRIATITKRRGTIRFTAADGRGGRRAIEAFAEQRGLPISVTRVGTFRAPGPAKPARVRGLKIRRSGGSARISWRRARGANAYVVRVTARRGVKMARLVGRRSLTVRHLPTGSTIAVSVQGRNAKGRTGRAARAKAKPKQAKKSKRSSKKRSKRKK